MDEHIKIACSGCGKILKVRQKDAGKKGKCPNCGKKIVVPAAEPVGDLLPKAPEPEKHCPTCGAFISPGDSMCVSCHTNLSTGEWNAEGKPVAPPLKLYYIAVIVLLVIVVFVGGLYAIRLSMQEDPKPLAEKKNPALASKEDDSFEKIKKMPENSIEDLKKKLEQLEISKSSIIEEYKSLLKKKRELKAQKAVEEASLEKDPILLWLKLEKLHCQFGETKYADAIRQKQVALNKEIQEKTRMVVENASEMFAGRKNKEAMIEGAQWLSRLVEFAYPIDSLHKEIQKYMQICQKADPSPSSAEPATKSPQDPVEPSSPPASKESLEQKLASVKNKIQDFFPIYLDFLEKWEYSKAVVEIAPVAEKARELVKQFPEDKELAKFIDLYEDAKILENFWKTAEKTMASLPEKTSAILLFKNPKKKGRRDAERGEIKKYESGNIHLETLDSKKIEVIALSELTPSSLSTLITANAKPSKLRETEKQELYLGLACFYYVSKEAAMTQDACQKAIKAGLASQKVERYMKWADGYLDELRKALEEQEKREAKALAERRDKGIEDSLQAKSNYGWGLTQRLLDAYRSKRDAEVLYYLEKIQRDIPRDEVIKIGKRLKKEEGQSLTKIAEIIYDHCEYCHDSGEVKCPDCRGTGEIELDASLSKAKKEKIMRKLQGNRNFILPCLFQQKTQPKVQTYFGLLQGIIME